MRLLSAIGLLLFSQVGLAAQALLDFSNSMYSFSADFTQTVYDSDSVVLQESKGQVELMRPGKFRWTYDEPIRQVIVADGLTLWVYDEDIAQVTMQPQATTLGSAPIGLLSGQREIESEFTIVELGDRDGLQWFQLEPLVKDTDFNQVFIALDNTGLRAMELRDNFEQATQIRFNNFKKNAPFSADQFQFTLPEGVDVVGEAGVAPPVAQEAPDTTEETPDTDEASVETAPAAQAENNTDNELLEAEMQPETDTLAPVSAEDVLQDAAPETLQEVPDDAPGIAETLPLEESESEITLEVIETIKVPVE